MKLYDLQHMNLYLQGIGFCLNEHQLPMNEVLPFLRAQKAAMLRMKISPDNTHPVIYTGYVQQRYEFTNIIPENSCEPATFSLSASMLKRRLDETVRIYTLSACEPVFTDYVPLLLRSLETLDTYLVDVLAAREKYVTREEYRQLQETLFRPLMQDLQPLAALAGDATLAEEMRLLNHDYKHVFVWLEQTQLLLNEHLPKTSIQLCVCWIRENIIDRLYELGADEEMLETMVNAHPSILKKRGK